MDQDDVVRRQKSSLQPNGITPTNPHPTSSARAAFELSSRSKIKIRMETTLVTRNSQFEVKGWNAGTVRVIGEDFFLFS
jgi:hypothetical protein